MPKFPIHNASKGNTAVLLPKGLQDDAIINFSSHQSFNRGKSYVKNGYVKGFIWNPKEKSLDGSVFGSGESKYQCSVEIGFQNGDAKIEGSYCDCPVRYQCKHCVAILLAGRKLVTKMNQNLLDDLEEDFEDENENSIWQSKIEELLNAKEANKTNIFRKVGLLFEYIETTVRTNQSFSFDNTAPKTKNQLAVRIVYLSDTNRWKTIDFNWKQLNSRNEIAQEINYDHFEWLCDFKNLVVDSSREYVYDDTIYILLDQAPTSKVFDMLVEAKNLGIDLYSKISVSSANEVIIEKNKAKLKVDIKSDNDNSNIDIKTIIEFNGEIIHSNKIGFLGKNSGSIYKIENANNLERTISIIMLDTVADSAVQNAVLDDLPITIPNRDIELFENEFLSKIQNRFEAVSSDDSVDIPEVIYPELLIQAKTSTNNNSLNVKLSWLYRYPKTTSHFILNSKDRAPLRNFVYEAKIINQVVKHLFKVEAFVNSNVFGQLVLNENVNLHGSELINFANDILPELKTIKRVVVEYVNDIPEYSEAIEIPQIEIGTSVNKESSGDWFNLDVTVKVGDNEIEFQDLFKALAQNDEYMILENGTYFSLDNSVLINLKNLINEAKEMQDKKSDTLQISRYHASFWDELKELGIIRNQANEWQRSIDGLLDIEKIEQVELPKELNATLRPYQLDGYQWLCFLYRNKLGAILGDDMGLGKTVQALAMISKVFEDIAKPKRQPFLVVAPTSVATNWLSESKKFAPALKTVLITQTGKKSGKTLLEQIDGADIVITSYTLLRIDFDSYSDTAKLNWAGMFLDEAQFIKNHQSKSYQCVRKLSAPFKLAMTGTPIENNLMELWALFSVTSPGLFGGPKKFVDVYKKPIEKDQDQEKLKQIRRRVRPLLLRRTKEQVVKELPPKIEQVLELQLNEDHRKVYDLVLARERQKVLGLIDDVDKNQFTILKSLTTLRMLSLDPSLVDAEKYAHVSSTKLDALVDQIKEVVGENHRALIFSQFTSFLSKVKARLDEENIEYCYLDGKTKNRGDVIEKFKTTKTPLFLISLKSGGFGLNLTEADYCFLLDPWWNPAAEAQAIDRTHRIGQNKQVMVYRLVSKDTIEEKVMLLKEKKAKLFKSVLDDGEIFSAKLTADDVKSLFQ